MIADRYSVQYGVVWRVATTSPIRVLNDVCSSIKKREWWLWDEGVD